MRKLVCWAVLACSLMGSIAAGATAKRKTPAKKNAATRAQSSTRRPTSGKKTAAKTVAQRPATTWRNRQAQPTPQRYREIQDALVAKGYLQPEDANGEWGSASVEALGRFQADQNLEASGKINALSLIALGLGPKHDATPSSKPAAPLPDQPANERP